MDIRVALGLAALLLASGTSYYVAVHGNNLVEDGPVAQALAASLLDPKLRSVDFAALARFPFTEMHVFEPFTKRPDICRAVGLAGLECLRKVPFQVGEAHYFVVFRQQTTVVHREYQSVQHGRYVGLPNGFRVSPLTSRFAVARNFGARAPDGAPQVYLAQQRQGLPAGMVP